MNTTRHIPYGVNCLYVYNETIGDRIVVLYARHTVSGQPYTDATLTLDEIMEFFDKENWCVKAGSS